MIDLYSVALMCGLTFAACEPEPVEETHVLMVESGLDLACEPMTLIIEIQPSSAEDCAQALVAADQPGLLSVFHEVDGASAPPDVEEAYLLLSCGQVLRQQRKRNVDCTDDSCTADPWRAWGSHDLCALDDCFSLEPGVMTDCEMVPDWTHEEMVAAAMP